MKYPSFVIAVALASSAAFAQSPASPDDVTPPPPAWDTEGQLRLSVQGGYDSNVRRDYEEGDAAPVGDLAGSLVLSVDGRATGERLELRGDYVGGARTFLEHRSQSLLTQAAHLDASYVLTRRLGMGLEANAKDRRGGERDYTDLQGGTFVDLLPDAAVDLRVRLAAHRFLYWENLDYSFRGPEGGASLRYRLDRRHALTGYGFLSSRLYRMEARALGDGDVLTLTGARRKDSVFEVGLGYGYRGRWAFTATYAYAESSSNSFGEAWRRHRLQLTSGFRLPWQLTLLAQAQAQLTSYPDGVFLSAELVLQEDEENSNSASLKLVRPLSERLDVEARCALYHHVLDAAGFTYLRQVVWAGFTLRL